MTLAAIDAYSISVFIHVTAVVVGFGATFAGPVLFSAAVTRGTRHLPYAHHVSLELSRRFATPALVLVLATGIYQTVDRWDFGQAWISATMAIVIIIGGLLGAYFIPTDRRLAAMAEREIAAGGGGDVELSDDYWRQARREGAIGGLTGLLLVAAVFLMITKPGV